MVYEKKIYGLPTTILQLIALRQYDGTLKIVQWEDGKELKAFLARLEDPTIIHLDFIHSAGGETTFSMV